MVALVASMRALPVDVAITERSRKFHEGKYQWDSDGFTDEHGVYREFDCLDPLARAPTPLPPMFIGDEDEAQIDMTITKPVQSLDSSSKVTSKGSAAVESDTPCHRPGSSAVAAKIPRTPGSIRRFAIKLLSKPESSKSGPQQEMFGDIQGTISMPSKLGTNVDESERAATCGELNRSYELCAAPSLEKRGNSSAKMPDTPPDSPVKMQSAIQISPASIVSTLSPVPSNLSDQDEGIKIKAASTAQNTPSLPDMPSKTASPKLKRTTTRGVAQKVTKASQRASMSKYDPPKRKNSMEDFTLLELHAGAFLRKGSLRKSARQARQEKN